MNRLELIAAINKDTGVEAKVIDSVVRAFVENTQKAVKKGDTVTLVGFGTFASAKSKARTGKNPRTGESIKIAAKVRPTFKAGKGFKDLLNGAKAAPKAAKPAAKKAAAKPAAKKAPAKKK
jgi:DNA-binding protein HU-beta